MSSVWLFQKPEDLRDSGEPDAPWYEPDSRRKEKSFGPTLGH